jgi:hypothetical protein
MKAVKLCLFGMIAVSTAVVVAAGCGSSSSQPPNPHDGGPSDGGAVAEAGLDAMAASATCNPIFDQLCAAGETCCFSGLVGTCVASGSCTAPFQVSCMTKSDCADGFCCGTVQLPAGFDAATINGQPLDASAFAGSGFDASGFGVTLACASSCPEPDFQLCTTTQDCPTGFRCTGGGGGAAFGGIMACVPIDAGGPPVFDAGSDDSGQASPPDSGDAAAPDASGGATPDAGDAG